MGKPAKKETRKETLAALRADVLRDLIATEHRDLLAEALDVLHGAPGIITHHLNSPPNPDVQYASVTPPDLKDARNGGTSDTPRLAPLRAAEPVFTRPAYEHDDDRAYRRRTRSAQFRQTGDIA